jgi:hypothetical protein
VTSFCTGNVFKMTPAGVQTTIGSGFSNPSGVDVDAAGNVWVADPGLGAVVEVAPDNTQSTVPFGDATYPVGIATDARGNVFDTDFTSPSTLQRSPDGSVSTVPGYGYDVAALDERDIPFTADAPTDAVPGDTYQVSAATEDSDAPISFAVATSSARQCQVTDNGDGTAEVDLNRVGDCTIEATQPGGEGTLPGYGEQTVSIRHRQAVTFASTSQRPQVDGTYEVKATGGGSENPVVFSLAEGSEDGCSVTADGRVTFDHATSCTVAADQAGDDSYVAASTAYQQIAIGRGDQVVTFTSAAPAKGGRQYLPAERHGWCHRAPRPDHRIGRLPGPQGAGHVHPRRHLPRLREPDGQRRLPAGQGTPDHRRGQEALARHHAPPRTYPVRGGRVSGARTYAEAGRARSVDVRGVRRPRLAVGL